MPKTDKPEDQQTPSSNMSKSVEKWAEEKKTADWLYGAARAVGGWGEGRELTEAEYDQVVAKAAGAKMTAGELIEKK